MIKYPILANTNASKFAFIKRAAELLRREHNIMGSWRREGIHLTQYQNLRAQVQADFPYYAEVLTDIDCKRYQADRFDVKMSKLWAAEGELKNLLYTSTRFNCNLDDDIN